MGHLVISPLLEATNLTKRFPIRRNPFGSATGWTEAVSQVSLSLRPGESVGLVGESGCGKSTLSLLLCMLLAPTSGTVHFHGQGAHALRGRHLLAFRRSVQMIFQDPVSSLNPLMRVHEIVSEPLVIHRVARGGELRKRVRLLLEEVGLDPSLELRFPETLSGGQRQRVGIARALAVEPEVVLMDEAFSAIDEVTAEILREEVTEIHEQTGKTFVLVTHNLSEALELSDKVVVLSSRPAKVKKIFTVELDRPRDRMHTSFIHMHRSILHLLKEELENTMIRHKLKGIPELQSLHDMEGSRKDNTGNEGRK